MWVYGSRVHHHHGAEAQQAVMVSEQQAERSHHKRPTGSTESKLRLVGGTWSLSARP